MADEKVKILVTGASGFVGSAVIERFQDVEKFEIYGLTEKSSANELEKQKNVKKIFRGDIAEFETLEKILETQRIDVLIHTAGLAHQFGRTKREDFWRVNVQGTENICNLARNLKVKHFILTSSVSVYGDYGAELIDENFVCKPSGFYAESKLESETKASGFCVENKIGLTILRLATVIGEGDRGNTARLITMIDKGRFFWIGGGFNQKSLIYKKDVAEAVLKIVENGANDEAEVYNLTNEPVAMREIVEAISGSLGKKSPRLKIPSGLIRVFFRLNKKTISLGFLERFEQTFEKWLSEDRFSGRKLYENFGFKPPTKISVALARQVEDYLRRKKSGL